MIAKRAYHRAMAHALLSSDRIDDAERHLDAIDVLTDAIAQE